MTPDQARAAKREAARLNRDANRALKSSRPKQPRKIAQPKRQVEADDGFMGWLHEGIPCVACLILGAPTPDQLKGERNPIEAAHQRRNDPRPGWQSNRLGKRVSHKQCVPLCRWHHQLAPNACDKAQGKFWDLLSVDVVDYCRSLYTAFVECASGREVALRVAASILHLPRKQGASQ